MSDKRKKLIRQVQADHPGMSYQAALNQLRAEQQAKFARIIQTQIIDPAARPSGLTPPTLTFEKD